MKNGYYINTKKLFRIWFSDDPYRFMPQRNQLRFVKMRYQNPEATISFIYDSQHLSEEAKQDLHTFCHKHRLHPVCVYEDLIEHIDPDNPLNLNTYHLALLEIEKCINKTGGNLCSASDILKLHPDVVEEFGIYLDFDIYPHFSSLPEHYPIDAPVLFPLHALSNGLSSNGEFLAFARSDSDCCLHQDAMKLLNIMQQIIVENYENPRMALTRPSIANMPIPYLNTSPFMLRLLYSLEQAIPSLSIFKIRQKIASLSSRDILQNGEYNFSDLDTMDDQVINTFHQTMLNHREQFFSYLDPLAQSGLMDREKLLKYHRHQLLLHSVTMMSGPYVLMEMLMRCYVPEPVWYQMHSSAIMPIAIWEAARERMERHNLRKSALHAHIHHQQDPLENQAGSLAENQTSEEEEEEEEGVGRFCDLSWTEIGNQKLRAYDNELEQAAKSIQRMWRIRK